MKWTIPGTLLTIEKENADGINLQFKAMFLAGDILLSQVTGITGLENYTVQNWVKRGFLAPPKNKRYSLNQLCRIISINMLKNALPIETVCKLLTYINGKMGDESDDIIDDSTLYFMFVRLASKARRLENEDGWDEAIKDELSTYNEPFEGAKKRIGEALKIMVTAYVASIFKSAAESMAENLNI